MKNAKAIRKAAPGVIPPTEPLEGFRSLVPLDVLKRFHRMSPAELADFPELQSARSSLSHPPVAPLADAPFRGTLHIVRPTFFTEANNSSISVTHGDAQTALEYATLAVQPIAAYTAAYGFVQLTVSPDVLEFGIAVTSTRYNDDFVQGIVNRILHDNHNHLGVGTPCIILLNPPEMTNTDADPSEILGYHDKADAPYCFVNLLGTGLTVDDQRDLFADTLSHEIAEMACDPDVSWFSPEVCDGCAGNCDNSWRNFFNPDPSPANAYIQSSKAFPPGFPFTYFIASIAKPSGAGDCPTRDDWCAYAPPAHTPRSQLLWHDSADDGTQVWVMDGARIAARHDVVDENGDRLLVGLPWQVVASGDLYGVGRSDIVWRNSTDHATQIWFMDGARIRSRANVFDENGHDIFIGPPWQIAGIGDTNGSGKADIVWHNASDNATQIWFMDGAGISSRANVVDENGNEMFIGPPWEIVGVGDMDGNRKADIVWHNADDNATQIWVMDGATITGGSDVVDENGHGIFIGPPWQIVGIGDTDGNGKADIVWYNTSDGATQIWFMDGARITRRSDVVDETGQGMFIGPPWQVVGVGDTDGNGRADIVWYNADDGTTQIWFMDGAQITGRSNVVDESGHGMSIGAPWHIVGCGDMDGSGQADIVWHNATPSSLQVWVMDALQPGARLEGRADVVDENGDGIFVGPPWQVVGSGDMDGNSKADIVWYNASDGTTQIWFMDGPRIVRRQDVVDENGDPILVGDPWRIVGIGDTYGNGRADIVWYNGSDGTTQIWYMNGARITGRSDVVDEAGNEILIGPPWQIVSVGDMDGDGKADIIWHNSADNSTQVWFMNGARIRNRANVVDENGNAIFVGPPWQTVGTGVA